MNNFEKLIEEITILANLLGYANQIRNEVEINLFSPNNKVISICSVESEVYYVWIGSECSIIHTYEEAREFIIKSL